MASDFNTAFRTTSERAEAYAHIAHELDILDTQARIGKKRHNSLSFSCRFPVEILSRIFLFVIEVEGGRDDDAWNLRWIPRISHVCSHWRQVALDNPQLWTVILTRSRKSVLEMLRRSKAALLTMDVYLGRHSTLQDFAENVVKNHHRIRRLIIQVGEEQENEPYLSLLDSAPALEICSIHPVSGSDHYFKIPDNFLNHAPRLHTLYLSCGISHTSSLLNDHLTSLELDCIGSLDFMRSVPSILNKTPNLHTLVLRGNLDCIDTIPSHSFPHLRYLDVADSPVAMLQFFKRFHYSKGLSAKVLLWPKEPRYYLTVHALGQFVRLVGDRMDPVLCLEAIDFERSYGYQIRAWDSAQLESDGLRLQSPPEARPRLEIYMYAKFGSRTRRMEIMSALWNGLPMAQSMHSLFLNGLKMTSSQWLMHFGSLTQLSNLHVNRYGRGLVQALSEQVGGLPSFQSLQYLTTKNWDDIHGKSLANCFAERRKKGITLLKLRLLSNRFALSDDHIALLRDSVVDIESDDFDGLQGEFDEDDVEKDGSECVSETTTDEDFNDNSDYDNENYGEEHWENSD